MSLAEYELGPWNDCAPEMTRLSKGTIGKVTGPAKAGAHGYSYVQFPKIEKDIPLQNELLRKLSPLEELALCG